jgi:hypothetical protein
MNTKAVKRLRKEIGYKPKEERKYVRHEYPRKVLLPDGKLVSTVAVTVEIDPADKRSLYQEMKKEL